MYKDDMLVHRIKEVKDTNCKSEEAGSSTVWVADVLQ